VVPALQRLHGLQVSAVHARANQEQGGHQVNGGGRPHASRSAYAVAHKARTEYGIFATTGVELPDVRTRISCPHSALS